MVSDDSLKFYSYYQKIMRISYRKMQRLFIQKKLWCIILSVFGIYCFMFYKNDDEPEIDLQHIFNEAKECLSKTFEKIPEHSYDWYWLTLDDHVNKCTKSLLSHLPIEEFYNEDEIKYGFLPLSNKSECNVMTLGIGRDVRSEKELFYKAKQCSFIGVDPDLNKSGKIYKTVLNGTFVQGLVGAKSGDYNSSVLGESDEINYKTKTLSHYSFKDFISRHYVPDFIDYLFMDIEGDEFALMEELIYHSKSYPTICQLNVEYHTPLQDNRGTNFFESFHKSIESGPFFPLKVQTKMNFFFNRIYYFNMDSFCVNKFLETYLQSNK